MNSGSGDLYFNGLVDILKSCLVSHFTIENRILGHNYGSDKEKVMRS